MNPTPQNPQNNSPILPHGGYEKLRSYRVAKVVYDATVVFCDRFLDKRSRTHDQMVQAARSGVRNISEASGAAATSRKSEMKLTNVARASLNDELLHDFQSFLTQRHLPVWPKDSPKARAMRKRLQHEQILAPTQKTHPTLTGLAGLPEFVGEASPEIAANAMLCAVNQAAYLLKCQLESQARAFTETGGFTESLHAARTRARASQGTSPEGPPCPLCSQPTRRRIAGKGPNAGQPFWGCTAYPDCRGTLPIAKETTP